MSDVFYDYKQHRNEEYAEDSRNRRTEDDGDAHGYSRRSACPAGNGQRDGTYDESQGCHDDRAETNLGRFDCCRYGIHATFIDTDFRVFDDQDGVLGSQADNGEYTNLEVNIILLIEQIGKGRSPEQAGRHTEQYSKRYLPAFVQGSQYQEYEEDSQTEYINGLISCFDFFTAHAAPFVGITFTERILGDFFQCIQGITRTVAIGRCPLNSNGRIIIEAVDNRSRTDRLGPDKIRYRYELSAAVLDIEMFIGINRLAELRRRLNDDFKVTAKNGEIIDLIGTIEGCSVVYKSLSDTPSRATMSRSISS